MNDTIQLPQLPFLTREMLKFGDKSAFKLLIASQANAAKIVKIRTVTRSGISEFAHTTLSTGAVKTELFGISDIPILVSVKDDSGAFNQGDCFVTLSLTIDGEVVYELSAGMVYGQKGVSWPSNNAIDAVPGHGRYRSLSVSDPAAGGHYEQSIPIGRLWRILAFHVEYQADANAGNRYLFFQAQDASNNPYLTVMKKTAIVANDDKLVTFAQFGHVEIEQIGDDNFIALPSEIVMPEAHIFYLEGGGAKAGDQFVGLTIMIEEYFAPPI
jgi:hypothetical protein